MKKTFRLYPAVPPLEIDFAAPAQRNRNFSAAGLALLLAGVLVAASAAVDIAALRERNDAGEKRIAALRKLAAGHRSGPAAPGPAAQSTTDDAAAAWKIADAVRQPWARLLQDLESAGRPQVAVLSVEAEARGSRNLRLKAEASNADEAFAYARRLGETASFSSVAMVAHEDIRIGSRDVFSFTLALAWKGAT